jgi:flagellar biosynthesis protein FlhG
MIADQTIVITTSNFAAIADAYGIIKVAVQEGYHGPIHLVVNRVRSPEEADQVFKKIRGCTERFLDFNVEWLGLLPEDSTANNAVQKRSPFVISFPDSVATRYLKRIVASVERMLPARAASV